MSKSSRSWCKRQAKDPFVQKAKEKGYRSRASFKLLQIHEKDRLFTQGMSVIDLGAAPGGWSQIVASEVGKSGQVIALDRLEMQPLPGVTFIQGDFTEESTLTLLNEALGHKKVDWVISDMAPNLCGMIEVDQPRSQYLAELAFMLAESRLKKGGGFLIKLFQGAGFSEYLQECRRHFAKVVIRKPLSSRAKSREVYLLAKGYQGQKKGVSVE